MYLRAPTGYNRRETPFVGIDPENSISSSDNQSTDFTDLEFSQRRNDGREQIQPRGWQTLVLSNESCGSIDALPRPDTVKNPLVI